MRNSASEKTVMLNAERTGDNLVLEVSYRGRGIPYHLQAHILDRFTAREHGGPGLGLALVHAFVELHEGWITIESDPREGASFKIHIPKQNLVGQGVTEVVGPRNSNLQFR